MNYQQYLNNIYNQIQETQILIDRIKCNYMLSSSEDEHTDQDIEILNNFNQSIPTPQFKDKQYHKQQQMHQFLMIIIHSHKSLIYSHI